MSQIDRIIGRYVAVADGVRIVGEERRRGRQQTTVCADLGTRTASISQRRSWKKINLSLNFENHKYSKDMKKNEALKMS